MSFDAIWCVQNCAGAMGILKCAPNSFAVQRLQYMNAAGLQCGCVEPCIEDGQSRCPLKDWGVEALHTAVWLTLSVNSAGFSAFCPDQFGSAYETLRRKFKQWIFNFFI